MSFVPEISDADLDTISALAKNQQSGRVRERDLQGLVAAYRALIETHNLIIEGALTGFNPCNGTWADRLLENQARISRALNRR